MTAADLALPRGVRVFERGWLSSNSVFLYDADGASLIDSGYHSHSQQTLELVRVATRACASECGLDSMQSLPLLNLVNTHLHSDHCGGNFALQTAYPNIETHIPPGQANSVAVWDADALSYTPTGQFCPQFSFTDCVCPGSDLVLAGRIWEVHGGPGHDPHSVLLFERENRCLISADALWERGFGVVFPELDGAESFEFVAQTLDLIEALQPRVVIPGHGRVFTAVNDSISIARERLKYFRSNPYAHAAHGIKALLKFHLLDIQSCSVEDIHSWCANTPIVTATHARFFSPTPIRMWFDALLTQLVNAGVASIDGRLLKNRTA